LRFHLSSSLVVAVAVVVVATAAYPKRPWDVWCNMKPEDG